MHLFFLASMPQNIIFFFTLIKDALLTAVKFLYFTWIGQINIGQTQRKRIGTIHPNLCNGLWFLSIQLSLGCHSSLDTVFNCNIVQRTYTISFSSRTLPDHWSDTSTILVANGHPEYQKPGWNDAHYDQSWQVHWNPKSPLRVGQLPTQPEGRRQTPATSPSSTDKQFAADTMEV